MGPSLCNVTFECDVAPKDWRNAVTTPLYKDVLLHWNEVRREDLRSVCSEGLAVGICWELGE